MVAIEAGLVIGIGLIIVAATIVSFIARILRQPLILAYIVAGLIIGPIGFRLITNSTEIIQLSEIGIALLLFGIGAETDFRKFLKLGKTLFIAGLLQIGITMGLTFGLTSLIGLEFITALYLAVIVAFSSTMVVIKILNDKRQTHTMHGRIMIGFLLIQDAIVVLALPLLKDIQALTDPMIVGGIFGKIILLFVIAVILNKALFPRVINFFQKSQELLFLTALTACFVFMGVSAYLEFPIAIGAFIAGIAISTIPFNLEAIGKIRGVRDFFATIFFVSLGMQISFAFTSIPLMLIVLLFAMIFVIKPIIYIVVTLVSGYGRNNAFLTGIGLAQVSEFGFIIAAQGLALGHISNDFYSMIILVTIVSIVTTPYLLNYNQLIANFLSKRLTVFKGKFFERQITELESIDKKKLDQHIIVVGAGRMGETIIQTLHKNHPIIAVENDPEVVTNLMNQKKNIVYGNVDNPLIWDKVKLNKAKLLVITIPELKEAIHSLKKAREANKKIVVFARAYNQEAALQLYKSGADYVVMPETIGANTFLKNISHYLETGKTYNISNFETEFISYLKNEVKKGKKNTIKT
ncbi:MAG: cation:proton antiporter [archaeon]